MLYIMPYNIFYNDITRVYVIKNLQGNTVSSHPTIMSANVKLEFLTNQEMQINSKRRIHDYFENYDRQK